LNSREAEDRTVRSLGVDMGSLVEAVADTWGRTLSAEALLLVVSERPAPARRMSACGREPTRWVQRRPMQLRR
jgi:hypothetical protein